MNLAEVLAQLDALGTEQNRKIYRRHGARDPLSGVSFAHLGKLRRTIRIDHALAVQLWASGNYDAMILAPMVADPAQATDSMLASWAADLYCYPLTDQLAAYVGQTSLAAATMERWIASDDEWIGRTGWHLVALHALRKESIADSVFERYLTIIEQQIHAAKNYTRHAMNNTLIAIGQRNDHLERLALAAAAGIGKVVVDHGQTSCKTPDAPSAILKAKARRTRVAVPART